MTATDALRELEQAAQRAAEARLRDVETRYYAEQEGDNDAWDDYEGDAPYCGCDTCLVREILHAAWPHLLELARLEADSEHD